MSTSVSLIISFYNKIDLLKLIFTSLEQQSFTHFEVIIADDGSTKEVTDEIDKLTNSYSFPIKHVWHEDKGWRKNIILNKAICAAETEYLIFIDGDCIPHPSFIQEHVEEGKPRQVICGRRVTLTESTSKLVTTRRICERKLHRALVLPLMFESLFRGERTNVVHMFRVTNNMLRKLFIRQKIKGILGCNFSAYKSDLLEVNGFDERFLHPGMGEDTDLDNRLINNGVRAVSKKFSITVYHMPHVQLDLNNEENIRLCNENKTNKVTFTPYGIVKH